MLRRRRRRVLPRDKALTRVFILYTGGTLGMVPSDPDNPMSPLVPGSEDDLLNSIPGLGYEEGIHWKVGRLQDGEGRILEPLDSSNVTPAHWVHMAKALEKVWDSYDGFVILHGTDTMAYTASALSFLLANLDKPVVLTGSQLPIRHVRTDAVLNLVNAVHIAGWKATELPCVPEVVICFGAQILRGNRSRKVSTESWEGFQSPNYPPLGEIGGYIRIHKERLLPATGGRFQVRDALDTNVMDLSLFPGLQPRDLKALLESDNLHGILLRTFGAGNAPSHKTEEGREFLSTVKTAVDNGKVVLNVTQCLEGTVQQGFYEASTGLLDRGVISALDMTPEAALTKLMWVLANHAGHETKTRLQIARCGEQSESLFDVLYEPAGPEETPLSVETLRAAPPGEFRRTRLSRAILRIRNIRFAGAGVGEEVELRIFINLPGASKETPLTDPHATRVLRAAYQGHGRHGFTIDITKVAKAVLEDGEISVTLVSGSEKGFRHDGLYLALFTEA